MAVRSILAFHLFSRIAYGSIFSSSNAANGRQVVKLHKQLVPVRSNGRVIAQKSAYFGNIWLGLPAQEFSVVFDTGSGHVVVPSKDCSSATCKIHRQYDRQASMFAQDVDYNGDTATPGEARDAITIAFGTGEVTGEFVQETLCMEEKEIGRDVSGNKTDFYSLAEMKEGDELLKSKDCVNVRVVTATEMTQDPFMSFSFDGVLGLGLEGLALAPEFSFFGSMVSQGHLSLPVFAVFLADSDEEESEISFGGHSPEHLEGSLTWVPVAMPDLGHWQVPIQGIRVGSHLLDYCGKGQDCRAVVDTGTSLLAVPRDLQGELQRQLGTPEVSDHDACEGLPGPTLSFELEGGYTITLTSEELARTPVQRPSNKTSEDNNQRIVCLPTMMPLTLPEPLGPKLFILGEPVLRKYYTVYNWEAKKIGFGRARRSAAEEDEEFPSLRGSLGKQDALMI